MVWFVVFFFGHSHKNKGSKKLKFETDTEKSNKRKKERKCWKIRFKILYSVSCSLFFDVLIPHDGGELDPVPQIVLIHRKKHEISSFIYIGYTI